MALYLLYSKMLILVPLEAIESFGLFKNQRNSIKKKKSVRTNVQIQQGCSTKSMPRNHLCFQKKGGGKKSPLPGLEDLMLLKCQFYPKQYIGSVQSLANLNDSFSPRIEHSILKLLGWRTLHPKAGCIKGGQCQQSKRQPVELGEIIFKLYIW